MSEENEIHIPIDRVLLIKSDCLKTLAELVDPEAEPQELKAAARILRIMQQLELLDEKIIKYTDTLGGLNKFKTNFIAMVDSELDRTPCKPVLVK